MGGAGSAVMGEPPPRHGLSKRAMLPAGSADEFIEAWRPQTACAAGLDAAGIGASIRKRLAAG